MLEAMLLRRRMSLFGSKATIVVSSVPAICHLFFLWLHSLLASFRSSDLSFACFLTNKKKKYDSSILHMEPMLMGPILNLQHMQHVSTWSTDYRCIWNTISLSCTAVSFEQKSSTKLLNCKSALHISHEGKWSLQTWKEESLTIW